MLSDNTICVGRSYTFIGFSLDLFSNSWKLKSIEIVGTYLSAFLCSKLSNTLYTKSCIDYDTCSVQTTNFRTRSKLEPGKVTLLQNPSEIGDAVEKP